MVYVCMDCSKTTFEITCPSCGTGFEEQGKGKNSSLVPDKLIPLDPPFYPEFQYKSKGLLKDFLSKKKEQAELNELLDRVQSKYAGLKSPYFVTTKRGQISQRGK